MQSIIQLEKRKKKKTRVGTSFFFFFLMYNTYIFSDMYTDLFFSFGRRRGKSFENRLFFIFYFFLMQTRIADSAFILWTSLYW